MASPNLFGTDLFQAYEQFSSPSVLNDVTMNTTTGQHHDTMNASSAPSTPSASPPPPSMPPNHPSIHNNRMQSSSSMSDDIPPSATTNTQFYDSNNIYNDMNMTQQLEVLKHELKKQRDINRLNRQDLQDSLIDRFVSKKKEVFRLVTMSMTILLAISIHFVLNDLIRNYIVNNNLSDNQELFTKIAYPLTILLIIWMFKVFNR